MKRCLAVLLSLTLVVGLLPSALAEESVTPTPPAWCPEEEYAVFPGSAAYEPGNWDIIVQTRQEVADGPVNLGSLPLRWKFHGLPDKRVVDGEEQYDFGVLLEQALIEVRLLYIHDSYNGPYWTSLSTVLENGEDEKLDGLTDQQRYAVLLWTARGILRYENVGEKLNKFLPYLMRYPQFTLETLTSSEIFTQQEREWYNRRLAQSWEDYNSHIEILLDGRALTLDVPPEVKNERTMVPIRAVAEALGADVEWFQELEQVAMTRAGVTVKMTLGSKVATVGDQKVVMDVAPYAANGRTLLPARYVAEFFGQKVDWNGEKRQVLITEDKSVAEGSNLEAWALPMGSMLNQINNAYPQIFGHGNARTASRAQGARNIMANSWSVESREGLVSTVLSMTIYGHDASFRDMAADVKLRTPEEREQISAQSNVWGSYMWEYTEQLDEKWGDRGIMAWDLFRMSNLVQWGYTAGYVTYEEALALVEPAATLLCENFSSWDEAYENYLDGYNWWARNDVLNQDIWGTERGKAYQKMKRDPKIGPIFDDTLFQTGVIPLPERDG